MQPAFAKQFHACSKMPTLGFKPRLPRPQRDVLTTRLSGPSGQAGLQIRRFGVRRGAGLYYRKDDHVVTQESQEDRPSSMFKAMTMCPVWYVCAIPQRYIEDPERWALTTIDEEIPPLGRVRWEHLLLVRLSHEQGNLFRLW